MPSTECNNIRLTFFGATLITIFFSIKTEKKNYNSHFYMISRDIKSNASSIIMQHEAPPQKMEVQQEQSVKKKLTKHAQSNFQKLKQSLHALEAANKLTANFFLLTFNSLEKYPTDEYLPNRQHPVKNFSRNPQKIIESQKSLNITDERRANCSQTTGERLASSTASHGLVLSGHYIFIPFLKTKVKSVRRKIGPDEK